MNLSVNIAGVTLKNPVTVASGTFGSGMEYSQFKRNGMLGCADCYKAFREPIEDMLIRMHGNAQHVGRVPGGVNSQVSLKLQIDKLKQQLLRAVSEEEYEMAASLRDQIRALTNELKVKAEIGEGANNE